MTERLTPYPEAGTETETGAAGQLTSYLRHRPKLRLERPVSWEHHRGGWKDVVGAIGRDLCVPGGVRILTAVEETMASGEVIREPWVGFVHEAPRHHRAFPDLERLLRMDTWKASVRRCLGLWTLSEYQRDYLREAGVGVPVSVLRYPVAAAPREFSFRRFEEGVPRSLLFVGEYLRNFPDFWELSAPGYDKTLLRCPDVDPAELAGRGDQPVRVLDRVPDDEYDRLLAESVVFLSLADAGANTTIVECMARGTPVLVNPVGGVREYLGEGYPLYYGDLGEAAAKLQDLDAIASAVCHLRCRPGPAGIPEFLTAMQNTAIYRSLPVPRAARTEFRDFDLTVLICSYRRAGGLPELLSRLAAQDCAARFEVIVWNNDASAAPEVQAACDGLGGALDVKVVHSSENYYCIVRLAAVSLMRSGLLLVCDDDVLPERGYVSRFLEAYHRYGPDAVVCARGNVFRPQVLDEENPESAWESMDGIDFYDEHDDDRPVHYMHADNCLLPRHVLRRALEFDLERYEFALVDDYWLSYVLSHRLKVPLWKIKADGAFSFTESADDPRVALYLSAPVREQVVNFYVHHMRDGWPSFGAVAGRAADAE
ncbi:glycosyltransferase [Planobispora siamensis]|uniref:Glycosyltransferase 2-like domain-containing protein n=1 Tax=Planobispora siamensis TaxID=936338 RepID=A0A8J3SHZ5_9ACTN|nr:glycosyltransferase [Planobispora siamensis]GIH92931.1 hypothetical protein Psi01_35610 [Planobispora siamensis]